MVMKKTILAIYTFVAAMAASAQTATVTFDSSDYGDIGVYDTWEQSPFRTGKLKGNAQVIDNHLKSATGSLKNKTSKILGVQRSRFGSNTFGVKITLPTAFATSETAQYVHVMVNKPNTSKVMLVGLGKRESFTDEPTTVEQFWVKATKSYATADKWQDMVFEVKTVSGVKIYSLVLVPDLQSPHTYDSDFACYIDQIEVNSSSTPRTGTYGSDEGGDSGSGEETKDDYYVNFDKDTENSRDAGSGSSKGERYIKGVSLTSTDGTSYIYTRQTTDESYKLVYKDLTETVTWNVKAGATYTPAIDYEGNWMQGYAYIDYDQDGQFTVKLNGNYRADDSEAVSYSGYNASSESTLYSSTGSAISGNNRDSWTMPSFTIPAATKAGIYRMRFKIDWNCIEPGGGDGSNSVNMQDIVNNGGGIVDVLLNVHDDNVTVSSECRNGALYASDGKTTLSSYSTAFNSDLAIVSTPASGFENDNIVVKHGYNLTGEQYVHSNRQWQTVTYQASEFGDNGAFTIPAEIVDGNLYITGNFKQKPYISLDETETLPDFTSGTANAKLSRTFAAGKYNTIVLPFALTQAQIATAFGSDAKAYAYLGDKNSVLYFRSMASSASTTANVPFLLVTNTTESLFTFDGVAMEYDANPTTQNIGTNYDFVGNYGGTITLDAGNWFICDNKFYRSVGKSTLSGYRGYFKPRTESEAKELTLMVDDETTGITTVISSENDSETYNLQGQRVNAKQLQRGVYVSKGKKRVVK